LTRNGAEAPEEDRVNKICSVILGSLVLVLGSVAPGLEGAESTDAKSAGAAFEKLKGLAGTWHALGTEGKKKRTTYEFVVSGSTLLERYVDESMPSGSEMLTLYHLDGGRLVLTHYCMAGNQPRMRMETASFDAAAGELQFEFMDATNLKSPADGHMHRARFRFEGPDQFTTEWEFFENDKPAFSEVVRMARVKP
jgi:hypothetical protein